MAKLQPAVSTILINVPANDAIYTDISQMASVVNRRFYRQGLNWAVSGFRCNQKGGTTAGRFQIEKLPETWVMSNAWHKAFSMWKKQQDEVMDDYEGQSAIAKFRDFKIFMDGPHVTAGFLANTKPIQPGGDAFTMGEWDPSQIVIPNDDEDAGGSDTLPVEYFLHMVGSNYGPSSLSRGMISGYQQSRSYPQSPDPVAPAQDNGFNWMRDMFNVGNNNPEVAANASDNNDELPYPQVDYPGGTTQAPVLQLHAHTDLFAPADGVTMVDNSFFMPGTQVPCGLLKFSNQTDQVIEVFIDLVPGHHRGYLCEPMQEF